MVSLDHLKQNLGLQDLLVYFQPIFNLRTGHVVGLEALLRPVRDDGTMIAPGLVFQRAEQDALLPDLEREARAISLQTFAEQNTESDLMIFLNFSAALLEQGGLNPEQILSTVQSHGLPASTVAVEFVESGVTSMEELNAFVHKVRASGFLMALDDFGTRNSHLERVASIRPDIIKIDRSIVSGAAADPSKRSVLRSTAYLGRTMGALTLAEGIETYDDLLACAREGIELGQGFLLGRPAPDVHRARHRREQHAEQQLERLGTDLYAHLRATSTRMRAVEEAVSALTARLQRADDADLEATLRDALADDTLFDCAYVVTMDGSQLTDTVMVPSQSAAARPPLFRPAPAGTNHRLKDFVYGPTALDRKEFLTTPYLSLATGTLCRTYARRFTSAAGTQLLLCVDSPYRE